MESIPVRHAADVDGPLRIELHDGASLQADTEDGGGMWMGEGPLGQEPFYEVCYLVDDDMFTVPQNQIARVVDVSTGEEVEFGNPYMPGHPRPREIGQDLETLGDDDPAGQADS